MVIKFPDENSQPIKHSPHIAGHEFIVMHMHTHFSLAIVSVPTYNVINKISRKMTALSLCLWAELWIIHSQIKAPLQHCSLFDAFTLGFVFVFFAINAQISVALDDVVFLVTLLWKKNIGTLCLVQSGVIRWIRKMILLKKNSTIN